MNLYTNGKINSSVMAEPFKDEDGKDVVYYVNTILTDDGVLTLNSSRSYESVKDIAGVIQIKCRQLYSENGNIKGSKLTLVGFLEGQMELPE